MTWRVGQTVERKGYPGEWMITMLDGLYLGLVRLDRDDEAAKVPASQVREHWSPAERLARGRLT